MGLITTGSRIYGTFGFQDGSSPITFLQFREHYLMWQQHPDTPNGLFVRAGRFMPVYGLRFAEHNDFTRQFGQTPLYGETYSAAVEYIDSAWEAHFTAFVHDPLQYSSEQGNGAALYAESTAHKLHSRLASKADTPRVTPTRAPPAASPRSTGSRPPTCCFSSKGRSSIRRSMLAANATSS